VIINVCGNNFRWRGGRGRSVDVAGWAEEFAWVTEIRRLFAKLITNTNQPTSFHLAWSR
jgi:hypothetical protein